ncbi:AMP-binding protein [Streptomyces sp. NPDC007088]|uniref:AMP-binding protein n=1 Tax=Streptomyces sp. NPDC007088 TaxID=3364773 RepID=UPI0036AC49D9
MIRLEHIRRRATARPDATAVVDGAIRLSWAEFAEAVERCAFGLAGHLPEARPARAVFLAGPRWELVVALAACATLGIPCAGLDPAQEPDRLADTLALLDPCLVFVGAEQRPALDAVTWPGATGALRIPLDRGACATGRAPEGPQGACHAGPCDGKRCATGVGDEPRALRPGSRSRTPETAEGGEAGGACACAGLDGEREPGPRAGSAERLFRELLKSAPADDQPNCPAGELLEFLTVVPGGPHCPAGELLEFLTVVPGGPRPRVAVRDAAAEGRALIGLMDEFGFDAHDTHLVAAPLWQPVSLQLARTLLMVGARVVLDDSGDAEILAALLAVEGVTTAMIEPGALGRVLAHPDSAHLAHTTRLRCVITPGRHLGRWAVDTAWTRLGPVLHLVHATPETGLSTLLCPEESLVARARTGRPVLGASVAVLDAEGAVLPAGRPGRVAFAGPQVMDGYLDGDAEFVTLDTGAGERRHLVTDDLGVLDERGRLTLTGRVGGVRPPVRDHAVDAALFRLESDLLNLPCLRDTAVIRLGLPTLGDVLLVPFVAVAVGREATGHTALRTACERRVPSIPAHVIAVDHIPRSPTGRIRTAELLRAVVPILSLSLQLEQCARHGIPA